MPDLDDLSAFRDLAVQVARAAGRMIREAHAQRAGGGDGGKLSVAVESKGSEQGAPAAEASVDLVTATDKACEELIIGTIRERFPKHCFIGEESTFAGGGAADAPLELGEQPTWIIDPLDGTTNFVHGYWPVTVSIGLAVRGELVLGVIFNPLLDEMCVATKGGGATLNGRPIRVGGAAGVGEALVVNNLGASRNPAMNTLATARIGALLQASLRGLRNSGSAAQNMIDVAAGRLDAYFEDGFGGPWDVAAGYVIVHEAGGVFRDHLGGPFTLRAGKGQVLCGNAAVVEDIARVLRSVEPGGGQARG